MSIWDSSTPYDPDSAVGRRIASEMTDILIDLGEAVATREALAAQAEIRQLAGAPMSVEAA